MRKLFITSVVFCIIFFILFGITVRILGRRGSGSSSTYIYNMTEKVTSKKGSIFSGDYASSGAWTILDQFPNININSAGIKTLITRGDGDRIKVRLDNPDEKTVHVEAVYAEGELTIEARSANITFLSDAPFGLVSWLEDIFTGTSGSTTVIIEFPETKYDSLNIQQGSGSMRVHDLYADNNTIHIGSGSFEMLRHSEGFVSDTFALELGSGKAVISGMQTDRYDIDIGSGSFEINDLSGAGLINMGSGSGSVAFREYNGDCDVDIASGSLKLYIPENSSMEITAGVASGSVDIDACGVKSRITMSSDEDTVVIGDGEPSLDVDLASGHVSVLDRNAYTPPVIKEIVITDYEDPTQSSILEQDVQSSVITGTEQDGYQSGSSSVNQAAVIPPDTADPGTGEISDPDQALATTTV